MARKQTPLPTMEDEFEVPEVVQQAADNYKKASVAKSRAGEKFNGAKESLIGVMKDMEIKRVRIEEDGNSKWIVLDEKDVLKIEKVATKPVASAE